MSQQAPLKSFRNSPWRYSQFVVLGALVAAAVHWLAPVGVAASLGIGVAVAIGYLLLEKKRGVI
ncbi:MAG: hypothetical protein Q4F49_01795 [Pseudoxanthomonas suwonensis]|nr:hypothetical protein [Pseudoxanthomonas suwonensis]